MYSGKQAITSKFIVTKGNTTVFSKVVRLDQTNNSEILNVTLPANSVGVQSYKAQIIPLETEKNKVNNYKNFAVEVIDQKSKIAIVSSVLHPDLGALKKSIESNEQRVVEFVSPKEIVKQLNDFQLVILYQPNNLFKELITALEKQNKNKWIISGPKTDWLFLNNAISDYSFEVTSQTEDYQPNLNTNYTPFIVDDLTLKAFRL